MTTSAKKKGGSGGDKEASFDAVRSNERVCCLLLLDTRYLYHTHPKRIHSHLPITNTTIMTDKETSASANTVAASTANPPPAPPAAEAIEEDDEFEEFEPCHWDKRDEDAEDSQQWQVSRLFMFKYYSLTSYYLLFIYVLRCTPRRRYCKIGYYYQQNGCR